MKKKDATSYSKVKKVELSRHVFPEFFKENPRTNTIDGETYQHRELIEVTDGLPSDAELIRIVPDHEYDNYWLIFESEEWGQLKKESQYL